MLKVGIFTTPDGGEYVLYEVNLRGYYRLDMMRDNGVFNIDIDKVAFSVIRKKRTLVYGKSELYDDYLRMSETLSTAKYKVDKNNRWSEDGIFETVIEQVNEKLDYKVHKVLHNGVEYESILQGDGYTLSMTVYDEGYQLMLDPVNISKYRSNTLSKDSVVETKQGLFYTLETLKRRYDLGHIEDNDYVVADTLDVARMRLKQFKEDPFEFRGFDTETTGLDVCIVGKDRMVGIILGHNLITATYFPFRHKNVENLPLSFLPELMKVVISLQDRSVAHNKKFDRQVMLKEGYDLRIKWDTLHISIVLNPALGKGIHGEKELMYQLDGNHYLELNEIFLTNAIDFSILPKDLIKYYACPDGTGPIKLLVDFLKKLPKNQRMLVQLECALADVKADQEYYGLRVDVKKFSHQYNNCNYIVDMLLKAFRTVTGSDGNINSSEYLADLMYNKMHCEVLVRTNTGKASTSLTAINKLAKVRAKKNHEVVEDLVDLDGNVVIKAKDLATSQYPAFVILSKYKKYIKLKTAFYARFERTMKTGRIFFWINQSGAATGRQSSPMHQLPPALKACILSDSDDRDFWGPDYSQVELRMVAYLAGEKKLIELSSDPDNDIHRVIGSLISGKDMWAITAEERSIGKRRNFGVVYTISAYGLAEQIMGPGYTSNDVAFCANQIDEFFNEFKRIRRYIQRNAIFVQRHGYIKTEWFHRVRPFKQILDPNCDEKTKAKILRMANNLPVQGTAADMMKFGEVRMDEYIRAKGWNKIMEDGFPMVRNMLSIHDEIIISAHQSIPYEEIIKMIRDCMEVSVKDAPPFFVQPARMSSWGDHESEQAAMPIRYRDQVIADYERTGKTVFKQAYFRLVLPDKAVVAINNEKESKKKLLDLYTSSCQLVYDHGDYEVEPTERHLKDALLRYIDSGFITYRIDNYIPLLNEFRHSQVAGYMQGLINQYGTDYNVVSEHVRHPSLTHALLGMYEDKLKKLDLTHEEKIKEATRMYIADEPIVINDVVLKEPVETDKDKFTQQLEPLVMFDKDGNMLYDDETEVDEDIIEFSEETHPEEAVRILMEKPSYAFELGDTITIDVNCLTPRQIDKVLAFVFESRDSSGFYTVNIAYDNKLADTKIRVESLDYEKLNDLIDNLIRST